MTMKDVMKLLIQSKNSFELGEKNSLNWPPVRYPMMQGKKISTVTKMFQII